MEQKRWFKVKYGYDVMDFVSVEESDLPRVLDAWNNNKIYIYGSNAVKGNEIKSISPHYHKYTGWNESYEPKDADDFREIERYCPKGLNASIENAKRFLTSGGKPDEYRLLLENKSV